MASSVHVDASCLFLLSKTGISGVKSLSCNTGYMVIYSLLICISCFACVLRNLFVHHVATWAKFEKTWLRTIRKAMEEQISVCVVAGLGFCLSSVPWKAASSEPERIMRRVQSVLFVKSRTFQY